MAFRTSDSAAEAYTQLKRRMKLIHDYCANRSTEFSSTTTRAVVLQTGIDVHAWKQDIDALTSTPGIAQYARDQEDDQTYNVVAEYTAAAATIDALITEIDTSFPKASGSNAVEVYTISGGTLTPLTFTPGQLNTIRGLLNNVVAAIDVT